MLAAGLLAKKAVEAGLETQPWVKTSLAPGSRVVTDYLDAAGLTPYLEKLGFSLVGYGCTTCIGNSGPLPDEVANARSTQNDLAVVAVLSGNRNFEGRIHPQVRASYLASPPLVVAYALAGHVDLDLTSEPLGTSPDGTPVSLRDLWPTPEEVREAIAAAVSPGAVQREYGRIFDGDERWRALPTPEGPIYEWDPDSTYVREPPFFEDLERGASERQPTSPATALPRQGRRLDHDRSHLAGGRDQAGLARGSLPDRARRRAARLQLVRRAARQPRGDDARHVRERAPAQRARPGTGGPVDDPPPGRRADDDLRRRDAVPRRGRPARRARGQGVRQRVLARLGRERAPRSSASAP